MLGCDLETVHIFGFYDDRFAAAVGDQLGVGDPVGAGDDHFVILLDERLHDVEKGVLRTVAGDDL
ncbi:hypothetical protein D3C81_2196530 [compost metagenome]